MVPKARLMQKEREGMTILNPVIYIDESGNLTDPNDPFVVVAALVAEQHDVKLRRIISKERRRLRMAKGKRKKERKVTEFKFRSVGDRTRQRVLERLGKQKVELFLIYLGEGRQGYNRHAEQLCRARVANLSRVFETIPQSSGDH